VIDAARFPRYARQRTENVVGEADHCRNMEMQANRFPHLPLLVVAIAVILSSSAGIAAIMAWIPTPAERPGESLARGPLSTALAEPVAVRARAAPIKLDGDVRAKAKAKCIGCGVIVSMRDTDPLDEGTRLDAARESVAGHTTRARQRSPQRYEMTIRLTDGSHRVFNEASPIRARPGGRVVVIEGVDPSKILHSPWWLTREYDFAP